MYNKGLVITGIVIFVVFFTSPFLIGLVKSGPPPQPELSPKAKLAKQCVEAKEYMVESHMQMLNDWRNEAVRMGKRIYVATDGKEETGDVVQSSDSPVCQLDSIVLLFYRLLDTPRKQKPEAAHTNTCE